MRNLFITQSDGTLLLAEEMGMLPIRSVLSGPSSGVIGAKAVATQLGIENYITLDMGGTSTDISAVQGGEPLMRGELDIGSYVIKTPSLDIHMVGAGGGSIARVDAGGHLKVGPESAGAEPGPAAYGKGGERPTVTDANVFLGFLSTAYPLAGGLALQREPAERVLRSVAETSGLSIEATAEGILAIEVSHMERAIRRLVAGRGIDLREQLLVVFGGSGPLHASRLARSLGVREIVVPTHPGLMCAIGLLVADMRRSFTTTRKLPAHDEGWRQGRRLLDELRATAQESPGNPARSCPPPNLPLQPRRASLAFSFAPLTLAASHGRVATARDGRPPARDPSTSLVGASFDDVASDGPATVREALACVSSGRPALWITPSRLTRFSTTTFIDANNPS